jgi:hypothetical protein
MIHYRSLRNFLLKYFFILKAAADGWRISYRGGNRFEFFNAEVVTSNPRTFADTYTNKLFL